MGLVLEDLEGDVARVPRATTTSIQLAPLGRRNHLFAGSDGGGARWAILASLIETAKLDGVEPYAYLREVLQIMIDGHPASRINELLPWAWNGGHSVKS